VSIDGGADSWAGEGSVMEVVPESFTVSVGRGRGFRGLLVAIAGCRIIAGERCDIA
jgi:hypothetical protein